MVPDVPQPIVKVANPQGGMDPNPTAKSPADGLVEQLAGMELRSDDARGGGKPINQAKVPAHQHDERKLFVGGLPTHGEFLFWGCFVAVCLMNELGSQLISYCVLLLFSFDCIVGLIHLVTNKFTIIFDHVPIVTEGEFLQFFEQFGEVIDSVVMIDRVTKRSRGFGFVTFAQEVRSLSNVDVLIFCTQSNSPNALLLSFISYQQEVAHSLLNSIPGKTGMINIQGKNCEIKASEPKSMTSPTPRYIHGSGGQRNHHHLPPNQGGYVPKPPHASPTLTAPVKVSSGMTPHLPNDRYFDSRNFDQLYNGHPSGYATNSMYSGYQYSGWENSYPYPYGQYGRDHSPYGAQAPQGYYEGYGGQYNYSQGGYAYSDGYYGGNYSGQTSSMPTTAQGAYRSLESYGEAYYEGTEGSD